jgi:hypothetical protein
MIWKAKYTHAKYANGTTRLKRVFAFLPTYIDGNIIWLSTYEILQAYVIQTTLAMLDLNEPNKATKFESGSWIDISKRLISNG